MSSTVYLTIMLGVMLVVTVVAVPALIRKKCPKCGVRNSLDAGVCTACGTEFHDTEE